MAITVDSLALDITHSGAGAAAKSLNSLSAALGKMAIAVASINTGNATFAANSIKALVDASAGAGGAAGNLKSLAGALSSIKTKLSGISGSNGIQSLSLLTGWFDVLGQRATGMANTPAAIQGVAESIKTLKTAVRNFDTEKFQQIITTLNTISPAAGAGASITAMSQQMSLLTTQMNKVMSTQSRNARRSGGIFGFGGRGLLGTAMRFGTIYFMASRISNVFASLIDDSNMFIENMNLFRVAMGDYADEALEYANTVQDIMGIDVADWIRNQGLFMMLYSGFGVATEQAKLMSQQLTQLGYDIASFYNVSVSQAMESLESGIVGQTKSVRRYGYDVSLAALQEVALSKGITESVNAMTNGEKATLRYIALMRQNSKVQGDMARTLESPANQLRILKAQLTLAGRALGNIFIPMISAVLPYLIAFARLVREVADAIASLFGFVLPTFDLGGISAASDATDELGESLSGAGGAAKDLKGSLASFDELNVITQTKGGGGGGGALGDLNSDWLEGLSLDTYDFLGNVKNKVDEIVDNIKAFVSEYSPLINTLTFGFLSLTAFNLLKKFVTWFGKLGKGGLIALGIGIIAAEFVTMKETFISFLSGDASVEKVALTFGAFEVALMAIGGLLMGPAGILLGAAIGGIAAVVAYAAALQQIKLDNAKAEVESFYGTVSLTEQEARGLADYLTETDFTLSMSGAAEAWDDVKGIRDEVSSLSDDLTQTKLLLEMGVLGEDEDVSDYVSKIKDEFIPKIKEQLQAENVSVGLTMSALFGEGSEEATSAAASSMYINTEFGNKLDSLAKAYTDYIEQAFADEEFTIDEQKYAEELYNSMQEAIALAQDMQHRQDVLVSIANFRMSDLSLSSYNVLRDEIISVANEKIDEAKQAVAQTQVTLENNVSKLEFLLQDEGLTSEQRYEYERKLMQYKAELESYDFDLALNARIDEINLKMSQDFYQAYIETWGEAFKKNLGEELTQMFSAGGGLEFDVQFEVNTEKGLGKQSALYASLQTMVEEIDASAAKMVKDRGGKESEWYKNLVQSLADSADAAANDKNTIKEYMALGEKIPQDILDGYTAYQQGKAITGTLAEKIAADQYLAAYNASESSDFQNALATMRGMGAGMPEEYKMGVLANMSSIVFAINAGMLPITQILAENLAAMGVDLRDYVSNLPQEINNYLKDRFDKQNWLYSINATLGISILTSITESVQYKQLVTKYGQDLADSMTQKVLSTANLGRIDQLASGGFPSSGSLFIANESGAELVGSFGNQAAVANTDQIVEGISIGVESANEKQNEKLDAVISLLQGIYEKDSGIEPSASWGAFLDRSAKEFARAGG